MPETQDARDLAERDPRVYLAGERTTLAWIRTGVTLMGFGFVVARFGLFLHELAAARAPRQRSGRGPRLSLWAGVALLLFGVWINLAAMARHIHFRNAFERGEPFATPRITMITVTAVLLGMLGIGLTAYLLVLAR
jgi:putative membrane protein